MQFQKLFPDAVIKPVRGNVLTRLEKLDRGEYGALLLAEAGLIRLGLAERISYRFSPNEMVPGCRTGHHGDPDPCRGICRAAAAAEP